ncbi:MAG TPA: glycosyltransferase family 4 protein, partial [Opitutaceae bacterium]|nr:glycosyltransferase family 4 protein [Opitutaceae bacterium]
IVVSHPTQYYSPWFRWLAAHTAIQLRVFYLWEFGVAAQRDRQFGATFKWDVDLLSGYEHEFVPNTAPDPGTHHFGGLRNPQLTARLAAWSPGAILLFGYKWSAHLRAIFWAWRRGIPLLFRGDSHFIGRGAPSWKTRLALRTLYARFAGFLYVGAANNDYFATLGVPPSRLYFAPHAVDASHYDPRPESTRAATATLRTQLGLAPSTRVVLFAGKFVPAKQPLELMRAFIALRAPDTALVMVGDGEEKGALHELAGTAPKGTIHFLPFANQSEMPARYLLADVFALPSRGFYETWGLAVNEAMHMGVPALVSDRVGCQRDLVTDGATGWVFPAEDHRALQARLAAALAGVRADREGFRARAQTRVSDYSYAAAARGLMQALEDLAAHQ